ncbi:MAG: hypothetical protein COB66_02375 [Coxiella sp. (in: Bacteria)]|nr:MAG: hypothetical protein COB66_02375 [Coxiella sp. (in: g-proteobacteria)]
MSASLCDFYAINTAALTRYFELRKEALFSCPCAVGEAVICASQLSHEEALIPYQQRRGQTQEQRY